MYKRFFVGLGSFKERGKGAKGSEENFLILMETWASWKQRKRREVEGSEVTSMQFLEHFSQVMVSPKAEAPIWGVLYLSGSCVSADAVHSTLLEAANLQRGFYTHTGMDPRMLGQACLQLCFLWQDVRMVYFHGTMVS